MAMKKPKTEDGGHPRALHWAKCLKTADEVRQRCAYTSQPTRLSFWACWERVVWE